MYTLTINLTSDEWIRIADAAAKQWPTETLSRAEIVRRYMMSGIQGLKSASAGEQTRAARRFAGINGRKRRAAKALDQS